MKHLFLFLVISLSISALAQDRIQDTFYGITFGTTRAKAVRILDRQGVQHYAAEDGVLVHNPIIGGMAWDWLKIYFTSNRFGYALFVRYFKSPSESLEFFERVQTSLKAKYIDHDPNGKYSFVFVDPYGDAVNLVLNTEPNDNGNFTVGLSYRSEKYNPLVMNAF